jgi:hypothetical protein
MLRKLTIGKMEAIMARPGILLQMAFIASAWAGAALVPPPVLAQEGDDQESQPELPDMAIYQAMLDANKQPGWIQFREYGDRQLIYFTALQTMRCRLKEIRYSIDSDALDKRFPLGSCDPQQPFNIPADDPDNRYLYVGLSAGEAKTLSIQVVWADGSGSEIVTYRPCDKVGESTCARIKTIAKPKNRPSAPTPSVQSH